ncbi:hypothetical protein GCM10009716_14370 [Streptomyces sodiiphilus]|uniref:DUF4034 domain-containing protein n=1 Tax=Streptomyces sodiiphilus TaxID=226217 RepID=A0ABP5A921_9ACTN
MEALLLMIALTAIFGVLVLPALRRRKERMEFQRAAEATEYRPGPQGWSAAGGQQESGVSLSKEGDADGGGRPEAATGLVSVEELDVRLPGPDPELVAALEETQRTQDWRPAGHLLALTDDSELRWQRVLSLAGAAAMELAQWQAERGPEAAEEAADRVSLGKQEQRRDAGWLRNWRAEEPRDHGGAQVYAQFLVWQAMSDTGSADSRIIFEEARAVCQEAAKLKPGDPVPHITELFVARGLGYGKPEFEEVWSRVLQRDNRHMGAHLAALTYWSEKWHGSRAEADGFAQSAAASAPAGSLLPALPLFAVHDHLPDVQLSPSMYQGAVIRNAIEAAQYAVGNVRQGHPVEPHVRHLLLYFLVRAERYAEAVEQVRAVDGYVGAVPWINSENPAGEYAAYRAIAVARQ